LKPGQAASEYNSSMALFSHFYPHLAQRESSKRLTLWRLAIYRTCGVIPIGQRITHDAHVCEGTADFHPT
jgi:hypothetical protein